ncbi:hypothetical protein IMG5_127560, partial [Ichthyophthirius multifiliis]
MQNNEYQDSQKQSIINDQIAYQNTNVLKPIDVNLYCSNQDQQIPNQEISKQGIQINQINNDKENTPDQEVKSITQIIDESREQNERVTKLISDTQSTIQRTMDSVNKTLESVAKTMIDIQETKDKIDNFSSNLGNKMDQFKNKIIEKFANDE